MKFQSMFLDRWSALEWSAIASRHNDLVCLELNEGRYRIHAAKKIHPEDIKQLEAMTIVAVIAQGQISRSNLDPGEQSFLQEELNRIRRNGN